jgi:hypothetical protein
MLSSILVNSEKGHKNLRTAKPKTRSLWATSVQAKPHKENWLKSLVVPATDQCYMCEASQNIKVEVFHF